MLFFPDILDVRKIAVKQDLHLKYKSYQNLLSTLLKYSKQQHFIDFFRSNNNDIKKYLERY